MMTKTWKEQLQDSFTCPKALLKYLELDEQEASLEAHKQFNFLVPKHFAQLITKKDPNCPLLKQVLPTRLEMNDQQQGLVDPLQEISAMKDGSLMQKFSSRVLFLTSTHCAVNCRYCFRRHFPYQENTSSLKGLISQIQALENKLEVFEVIFSGGDPLTLSNASLEKILQTFEKVPTLQVARFHTRLPVVLPDRVDNKLLEILSTLKKKCIFVLHLNHPQEISPELVDKVALFKSLGIDVLNQAVLLKGVNDSLSVQYSLWKSLSLAGIAAYYLHQLDLVKGGVHFFVDPQKGKKLIEDLRSKLPGYMIPTYVQEVPQATSKVPLT